MAPAGCFGCTRPVTPSDKDHVTPAPAGPTTPANLAGLCRRYHRLKQQPRWQLSMTAAGVCTWTTPTGTIRITRPDLEAEILHSENLHGESQHGEIQHGEARRGDKRPPECGHLPRHREPDPPPF